MQEHDRAPFTGANALIFGGGKGIGKAVAEEWARRGAHIAVADIDRAAADEAAQAISSSGGRAFPLPADVTCDDSVAAAVTAAEEEFGQVDILMNNVGAALNGHPEDIPISEWRRITELNYFGTIRATALLLPKMLARKSGFIVNTASFAGLYPYAASRMPYAASKAAVISLSQSLALYLEPQGIRVSCLIPGPVLTDIMSSMTSWTEDCPLRGPGAELEMIMPEQLAVTLADGMAEGQILIPSHQEVWSIIRRWSENPDLFIRSKIRDFENGDLGRPSIPAEILAHMAAKKD
jgi:NAD(P)-dependent dehydrogenase (short-subunit alcohol dehydrogenase family)